MNPKRSICITSLCFIVALLAVLGATAHPAYAAGTVTDCSQFGAIGVAGTLANALNGGGTVTFSCSGTIPVTSITAQG